MSDWSKPLRSLADAERFYRAFYCSHFHMGRELPDRLDEYIAFRVTRATEDAWMREDCEMRLAEMLQATGVSPTLWSEHSIVSKFIERLRAPDLLIRFEAVTRHLQKLIPDEDRILVAETIIGRYDPDAPEGPIRLARSLREFGVAASLSALVPAYLDGNTEIAGAARPLEERKVEVIRRLRALNQA